MNINTLMENLREALHDDEALQVWSNVHYGSYHKVYVGIDTRNPPGEDDYPLVHLFPIEKTVGYEMDAQDHVIGVTCGIHDTATLTLARENLVEYRGMTYIEEFRKLAETAIAGADIGTLRIDALRIEYETVEFFPYFLATMEITMRGDYYQGDDVFA